MDDLITTMLAEYGETATVQRTSVAILCQFASPKVPYPMETMAGEAGVSKRRLLTGTGLDIQALDYIIRSDGSQWQVEGNGTLQQSGVPNTPDYRAWMEYAVRSF